MTENPAPFLISPADEHNQRLADYIDPARLTAPRPAQRYNLVVIGAGTAGLVTAAGAAGLGAKVALIERRLMGGDCLNYGCVPSKALLSAARAVAQVREASRFGAHVEGETRVDFASIMERMRRVRAELAVNDSVARFAGLGVDVFAGEGRFVGRDQLQVGDQLLRFRRAVIATGARAAAPSILGFAEVDYLTNETVFSLTALPRRLAVIGAGAVGCELAQAFRRFGATVTVFEVASRILPREDADAAERIHQALCGDGVEILTGTSIARIVRDGAAKVIYFEHQGVAREAAVDALLMGTGRAPNVEHLGLETVGVEYDRNGIRVDDFLRTTNPCIYAAGDICTPHKFTHVADAMARIVIRNALFFGRARMSALTIPRCIYTDPEIVQVGLTPDEAADRGIKTRTFVQEMAHVDRAVIDGETEGFVKVHVVERSDRIVGATIVARHASEMISELTFAISHKVGLGAIANLIHPYPTQAEAIKKLGDAYNRTRLTPVLKRVLERWMAWHR